jgi:peptide/nickel transport system permease protein
MLIAAFIGIPIGALAGFMGDERLRVRRVPFMIHLLFGFLACYFIALSFYGGAMNTLLFAGCCILLIGITTLLARRFGQDAKSWIIPADTITLRSIEIIRSIPAFFLLFAILGMLESPGLIFVIVLIAFLWCPSIIRFVRAEALKLRNQPYVHSAIVLGLSDIKVIWRHIIPNAIGPALITIVFGIGSAVLIESGLSFLGIGIGPETVSWGKMLNLARSNFSAWWMALLPGAAIFLTITFFHRLGDVMESQITGR